MKYQIIQSQYDKIYSYFKTTSEPFDFLEWNGEILQIWNGDVVVERYTLRELNSIVSLNKLN